MKTAPATPDQASALHDLGFTAHADGTWWRLGYGSDLDGAIHRAVKLARSALRRLGKSPTSARRAAPVKTLPGESRKDKKARKDADRRAALTKMHDDVWALNLLSTASPGAPHGECDCGCGYAFRSHDEGECDHWIERSRGGPDAAENGWRLRAGCHANKHASRHGDRPWNDRRRAYCERVGIPFVERREKRIGGRHA